MKIISHDEYASEDLKIYNILKEQKEIEYLNFDGVEIEIHPNVFSPKYFTDSFWFAKEIAIIVAGKKFLEIGSGTGVIALHAALSGCKVVATDLNPAAVQNTIANFKKHNVIGEFIQSDLFDMLANNYKFDYIFWNHPFFEADEKVSDLLLRAGFDFKYQGLKRYLERASDFLEENGKILLGTGSAAKLERIFQICYDLSLQYELLKKVELPVNPGSDIMNDYRIYLISDIRK